MPKLGSGFGNALLLVLILVVAAVTGLNQYTLNQHQKWYQDAEAYHTEALAGINEAAYHLELIYEKQLAFAEITGEYNTYLNILTKALAGQQEQTKKYESLFDDLTNKYVERCKQTAEYRTKTVILRQVYDIAREWIIKARKILNANNLPWPDVKYDGPDLFQEGSDSDAAPASDDKET